MSGSGSAPAGLFTRAVRPIAVVRQAKRAAAIAAPLRNGPLKRAAFHQGIYHCQHEYGRSPPAQRSVRSEHRRGQARSTRNAPKHGLRAPLPVLLDDEDAADFAAFEPAARVELAPAGALESDLSRAS
jgi:hypothetical protein